MAPTLLLLLSLLLSLCPSVVYSGTVSFTIVMPNSTYPGLGEVYEGTLTYNDTFDPHLQASSFGYGHLMTAVTGTRSVWTATKEENTSYTLDSVANILGLLPDMPQYYYYNATINGLDVSSTFEDGTTVYGTLLGNYFCNSTEYPSGICTYKTYFVIYDNLYYPDNPDHMDNAGWMFVLDRPQPGNVNITGNPGYSQYPNTVNIFGSDGNASASGDISDSINYPPGNPEGLSAATAGFNGLITTTEATVKGDPQFVGLRGQSFQVHGLDGAVYNLLSDSALQVNSRFVFLASGQCPILDGFADTNCWSHPGSYIGELGFQYLSADKALHTAYLSAGPAQRGFVSVQLDGRPLQVGEQAGPQPVEPQGLRVQRLSSHAVVVETEHFRFVLHSSDHFINQELQVKVPLSQLTTVHGLLGQTHSTNMYKGAVKYIEGEVDDYALPSNDIFGSDFAYNRFQGGQ